MKLPWAKFVCAGFAVGLTAMFLTAYFYPVHVGWEIWWEIPLVVGLTILAWIGG